MATESAGAHEPGDVNESAITVSGDSPGRAIIDRDACMGSGNCSFWAPGVFDLDDDGIAVVVGDLAGHEEQVRSAAENCPTSAIRVDGIFPTDR
jgi:ferredoxin